jgi:hypothetical protein
MTTDYPRDPKPRQPYEPWPAGPWDDEPDNQAWTEPETGYRCCAMRQPQLGNWLGYVRVDPDSLLARMSSNDRVTIPPSWREKQMMIGSDIGVIDLFCEAFNPDRKDDGRLPLGMLLAVHGGITYSDGEWFGFDCGHAGDLAPFMPARFALMGEIYRSLEFVRHEVNQLAWQLKELDAAMAAVANQQLTEHR